MVSTLLTLIQAAILCVHFLNLFQNLCAGTHCNVNSVYIFLFWELRGLSPNFHIHVSVSDLYIFPGSVHIFPPSEKADPSWEYIIRSQTHECGNWDWGPDIPFLVIFVSAFCLCSAGMAWRGAAGCLWTFPRWHCWQSRHMAAASSATLLSIVIHTKCAVTMHLVAHMPGWATLWMVWKTSGLPASGHSGLVMPCSMLGPQGDDSSPPPLCGLIFFKATDVSAWPVRL